MGFPEQLDRDHRDTVLIANSTAGAVVGDRDRFAPLDRPTTLAPQDQPVPQLMPAPGDHTHRHAENQTYCRTRISTDAPPDQTGDQNADVDRQFRRRRHRARRARATSHAKMTAATTTPAKANAILRAR